MDKDFLQRLASKAGNKQFNSPQIPTLKLDGTAVGDTAGQFILFKDKVAEPQGNKVKIRILRVRKILSGYEEGPNNTSKSFSSGEYDSAKHEIVTLFVREGESSKMVAEKTPQELREEYPLKVVSIVYAIYNGELVKFRVKGASTAGDNGLYNYLDKLREEGTEPFTVETNVGVQLIKKNRAVSYNACVFSEGKALSDGYEDVETNLDLINKIIESKKRVQGTVATHVIVSTDPQDTPDVAPTEEDNEEKW